MAYRVRAGMGDAGTQIAGGAVALGTSALAQGVTPELVSYCSGGRWNWFTAAGCWQYPPEQWQAMNASTYTAVPPGPVNLTLPPASGTDADAEIQAAVDEQMRRQQALDAGGVESSWLDQAASGVVDTANALNPMNWNWALLATALLVGVVGLAALGAGSPRRYGR